MKMVCLYLFINTYVIEKSETMENLCKTANNIGGIKRPKKKSNKKTKKNE
jgi:hypothetical protein